MYGAMYGLIKPSAARLMNAIAQGYRRPHDSWKPDAARSVNTSAAPGHVTPYQQGALQYARVYATCAAAGVSNAQPATHSDLAAVLCAALVCRAGRQRERHFCSKINWGSLYHGGSHTAALPSCAQSLCRQLRYCWAAGVRLARGIVCAVPCSAWLRR